MPQSSGPRLWDTALIERAPERHGKPCPLLNAVGIFALVANMVAQRMRETGIRIALESSLRQAMAQIAAPGIRASALGLACGLVLCACALRIMRTVIYGINVYDSPSILSVVVALLFISLIATAAPTLRIATIDPAKTLREE